MSPNTKRGTYEFRYERGTYESYYEKGKCMSPNMENGT